MPEPVAQLPDVMHVMAGVMRDPIGRVLLAKRPPGKHLAGLWEFPAANSSPVNRRSQHSHANVARSWVSSCNRPNR